MEPDASASAGYQMVAASRRTGMGLPVLDRSLGRKQAATTQKDLISAPTVAQSRELHRRDDQCGDGRR
jgi:hypothetical protein